MHSTFRWSLRAAAALGVASVLAPSLAHAQTFEGIMTFVTRDAAGKKADTVVQTVKGRSMRMNGMSRRAGKGESGDGGGMIIDGEKKRMIVIDDQEKTAMVMSQADQEKMKAMTEGLMKGMKSPTPKAPAPKAPANDDDGLSITKTGRTETVAGVRCDVYHGTSNRKGKPSEGDVCVADGVGFALFSAMASNPMFQTSGRQGFGEFRKLFADGKGLVKATTIENGKSYVSLELIKVERKSVPSSAFDPPAGYTVTNFGDMMSKAAGAMQQMQQGRKGKPPVF
jgi:hypothetical protein